MAPRMPSVPQAYTGRFRRVVEYCLTSRVGSLIKDENVSNDTRESTVCLLAGLVFELRQDDIKAACNVRCFFYCVPFAHNHLKQLRYFFMSKNIYVGNLPWSVSEDEVRSAFEQYGQVNSVNLISDRETGRPRGFGFVEMDDAGAMEAIKNMDGKDFGGRNLKVNEARPRAEKPRW